ncbi:MAG TPA: IS5 family transposase [Pseudonocardiaceae bacterium]|jgi:transposase|nr:IS5 family transposase [Pseudonocardiaceae bacterium]
MHDRHDLTDVEWEQLEPLLPDRMPRRGGRWCDHRPVINGVLWRTRTGSPWQDLPPAYGNWKTVYSRHRRWSGDGTWEVILDGLRVGCDLDEGSEWTVGVDSTVVRGHQHAAGARHAPPKDIPAERLAPLLRDPQPSPKPAAEPEPSAAPNPAQDTGGWVEWQESGAGEGGVR